MTKAPNENTACQLRVEWTDTQAKDWVLLVCCHFNA